MKSVSAGMNPMDLKRGIDKAVTAAVEELKNYQNHVQIPVLSHRLEPYLQTLIQVSVTLLPKRWIKLVKKV
jgi:chaperonin GroEL (HSP60 family)